MSKVDESIDPVDNTDHDTEMARKADESGVTITSGKQKPNSEDSTDVQVDESRQQVDENQSDDNNPARPENVPEKFWDAEKGEVNTEALLKSYRELESGRDTKDGKKDDSESEESDQSTQDTAVSKAMSEYEENGQLSDETYKSLEDAGLDRNTVDSYISGMEATRMLAFTAAGDEESYNEMIQWASKNLTDTEITEYDKALAGSPAEIVEAVKGLAKRYSAESHKEGRLVNGNNKSTPSIEGFRSKSEMVAAMSDPRYADDPAFRDEVARKIASSERAGVNLTM